MGVLDTYSRPLRNLRISVTDRCNLRCQYCMPEEKYVWLPKDEILRFEEISTLIDIFCSLGVDKVRITGGEPLLRQNLSSLLSMISHKSAVKDLALTTNGVFLAEQALELKNAGLSRVTVSLDTLRSERYLSLTRRDHFQKTLDGILAAKKIGFTSLKLNTVVMRGVNDDELIELVLFAKEHQYEPRFIEYMDVGGATHWSSDIVVSQKEIVARLSSYFGEIRPEEEPQGSSPAERFVLPDGTRFGVIASTTTPFCGACDRSRLTADGNWYQCLYAKRGLDLRQEIRRGSSFEAIQTLIKTSWQKRTDKGAEQRVQLQKRGPFVVQEELQKDPRLEMHTRGG
jgi:cyclic pyranopterin phosphate synthase